MPDAPAHRRVDVWWTAPLDVPDALLLPVLSAVERERAAGLPPAGRTAFVQARVLLRAAVAARTGARPEAVPLRARCPDCGGPHGRVTLGVPPGTPALHVALSRTGPLVAVAVTAAGPVGVDVAGHADATAARLEDVALSPLERARWARTPAHARPAALARTWARTEAVLKACGTGLRVDPTLVDVRRGRVRVPVPGGTARVHVRDVPLAPGVAAAVALDVTSRHRAVLRWGVATHDGGPLLRAASTP